ncbi:MAG: hypothetical protein WC876_07965 [Candidatus Thermoplasmatota archaeon]|jgi:indole-3-glycerol phosphate synthase/phosphoribosylanthranilate isomerase
MKAPLTTFLDAARKRVEAGAYRLEGPALRPNGSLASIVRRGGAILAEVKPTSPSEGRLLRRPAREVLSEFTQGGADGLSLCTDADRFDGSPALLREAHATGLPTLMTDFVVDEAQLDCARHNGASAVRLIERALGAERREALVAAAHARGLEILLEISDAAEWQIARSSKADLTGVDARDPNLALDSAAATILLGQIAQERPGTVVALFDVNDRAGVRLAHAVGAGAALVGTSLLRSPDPILLLRSLRHPLAMVCGLRTAADVAVVAQAGADLAGFELGTPGSPRNLNTLEAQRLADQARALGLRPVLVTRSMELATVREWCRFVRPDYVQLHGPAPPEWVHSLAAIPVHVLFALGPTTDGPTAEIFAEGAGLIIDLHADGALESMPGHLDPARVVAFVKAVQSA